MESLSTTDLLISSKGKQKLADCISLEDTNGPAKKHKQNNYDNNNISITPSFTNHDDDSLSSKQAASSVISSNSEPDDLNQIPSLASSKSKNDLDNEASSSTTTSTSSLLFNPKSTIASNMNWIEMFKNHNLPIRGCDLKNPRQLLGHLLPNIDTTNLPTNLDDFEICRLIYQLMSSTNSPCDDQSSSFAAAVSSLFMVEREKLLDINTLEQCVNMIDKCKNIIVLTGAGCSVSCGIPDFRSRDGVYARLRVDFPDLPDPQAMFDILYFQHDPRPFFKFAKEIYPGQFKPSLSHKFIKKLEESGKLLRNYTQNIDTLEMAADIKNSILCHGSFATASCTVCKIKVGSEFIREKIFNQEIPYCEKCKVNNESDRTQSEEDAASSSSTSTGSFNSRAGILKPDIVFFGEGLPDIYHQSISEDKQKCDLLIVIGSSLKVKPVANIPHLLPSDVPQILINRESLKHMNFDVELLGDCDGIVNELLLRLEEKRKQTQTTTECPDWSNICFKKEMLTQIASQEAEFNFFNSKKISDGSETICLPTSTDTKEATAIECDEKCDKKEANFTCERYKKDFLNENTFLYLKPNIYVFHGAEVSIRNIKKKLRSLRKKLAISDELTSSESDENVGINSDKKESKHSYLSDIYKTQPNRIEDDDDDDDEFDDEFSTDETDSDTAESGDTSDSSAEEMENNRKILNEENSDDENDEDFSLERSLSKNNLVEFLSENIEKKLKNKDS